LTTAFTGSAEKCAEERDEIALGMTSAQRRAQARLRRHARADVCSESEERQRHSVPATAFKTPVGMHRGTQGVLVKSAERSLSSTRASATGPHSCGCLRRSHESKMALGAPATPLTVPAKKRRTHPIDSDNAMPIEESQQVRAQRRRFHLRANFGSPRKGSPYTQHLTRVFITRAGTCAGVLFRL
jgi:hypothetical protein